MQTAKQAILERVLNVLAMAGKSPDPEIQAEAAEMAAEMNRRLAKAVRSGSAAMAGFPVTEPDKALA